MFVLGANDQRPAVCIGERHEGFTNIFGHVAHLAAALLIGPVQSALELAEVAFAKREVILQAFLNEQYLAIQGLFLHRLLRNVS